jgi:ribosomal protein S18 acetylase RimI-like enzyme
MIARPATLADTAELVRIVNLAYVVEAEIFHGDRTSEPDVRARIATPNAAFLVIPDDAAGAAPGALAGSVCVETRGNRGFFGMLAVDPNRQGRGLGRALVRAAEEYSRARGCAHMDLDVVHLRRELTQFYGSLGYTVIGEADYPRPEETTLPVKLIHMTKPLSFRAAGEESSSSR